jgi:hypothetical protein
MRWTHQRPPRPSSLLFVACLAAGLRAVALGVPGAAGMPGVLAAAEPGGAGSSAAASESAADAVPSEPPVQFNRDVQPILSQHCFKCHGPAQQEGGLRLDLREAALGEADSGARAIIPGDVQRSELLRRVTSHVEGYRMPAEGEPLAQQSIAVLRAWIAAGAPYEKHWAFQPPRRPALPAVQHADWCRNPIDYFILARMEAAGWQPSPPADREKWLRRVTLDLTGLPPTVQEIDDFLADKRPDAAQRVVDRLLASPRFGERWARPWLDAARYGDSNGYQRDNRREAWAYRDWVVQALNADMPFDQFTIEQMAGDLLPGASLSQRIATGFHRNTLVNIEAGTDPEEERVNAVVDRVNTVATVWLGLTLECAQCHDHKYDPFTQRDYYQLYAFFNGTEDEIRKVGSRRDFVGPWVELPLTGEQQQRRAELQAQIADVQSRLDASLRAARAQLDTQIAQASRQQAGPRWHVLEVLEAVATGGARLVLQEDGSLLATGPNPPHATYTVTTQTRVTGITAARLEVLTDPSLPDGGPGRGDRPNFILSELALEMASVNDPTQVFPVPIASASADFSQNGYPVAAAIDGNTKTGWAINPEFSKPHTAVFVLKEPAGFSEGTRLTFRLDQQYGQQRTIGRFRLSVTSDAIDNAPADDEIRRILALPPSQRTAKQQQQLEEHFLAGVPEIQRLRQQLAQLQQQLASIAPYTALVMKEMPQPRPTHVLQRGDFLKPGDEVQPGVPAALHPLRHLLSTSAAGVRARAHPQRPQTPEEVHTQPQARSGPIEQPPDRLHAATSDPSRRPNRLDLAHWLVDENNPLTARVTVNRLWAELYGRGLVTTPEDFGTQGQPPTHPELLDYLATEFMQQGWSVKHMLRLMVTSAAYAQDSRVTPELWRRDPENSWYARGPRFRMDAEMIRDSLLAASGLLSQRLYGPPVFPYQPPGVWNHIGQTDNNYVQSQGDDQYRRALYVYLRRSVPYPSFVNFDMPSREQCVVQRSRSNTPLQALTLLNDPVYVEAAGSLAGLLLRELPQASAQERIVYAFRRVLGRTPRSDELALLRDAYAQELAHYRANPEAARRLRERWMPELYRETNPQVETASGRAARPVAGDEDAVEFAAWFQVAGVLLNLDEAITKN